MGSPAVTTRGFGEAEMTKVGQLIADALLNIGNEEAVERVRKGVNDLTDAFPLYSWKRARSAAS